MNEFEVGPAEFPECGSVVDGVFVHIVECLVCQIGLCFVMRLLTLNFWPVDFSNWRRKLPIRVDSGSGCSHSLRGTDAIVNIGIQRIVA
jgi:hypothetical protein